MSITTFDATTETSNNAKVKVSGLQNSSYRVGLSPGATYAGPAFAGSAVYSSLTNGIVDSTLSTPASAPGSLYTLRVFNADGSCFSDSTFTLPFVNFNYTPEYVDIQTTITRIASGDIPLGDSTIVTIAVQNAGSLDATGVEFTVVSASGLTMLSNNTAAGTFASGTGIWNIGTIPAGTTVSLTIKYLVTQRGIREVTAQNTALNEVDVDSSPIPNVEVEDDEGQICITTHKDYCAGDEYTFLLSSGIYTNVVWQRSTDNGVTWSNITGSTADYEILTSGVNAGALVIKSLGDYKYYRDSTAGACAFEGCCPIKVIPGLPPILTTPNSEVICFGDTPPIVQSANTQTGYTPTTHTTYGIPTQLPPFLSDQGDFRYRWYNNNGPSNPNTDSLITEDTLRIRTLPTAVGVYDYRLISIQNGHESCRDTTEVRFIVNELPVPVASSNSPVCAEDTIFLSAYNAALGNSINPVLPLAWSWVGPDSYSHNDSTGQRLLATEAMEGEYIVTASYSTNGLACSNKDTVFVVINPLPDMPRAIDTSYCQFIQPDRLSALMRIPPVSHNGDSLRWFFGPNLPTSIQKPDTTTRIGYNVGPWAQTNTPGQDIWYVAQVDGNNCQSHIDTLTIDVRDQPDMPTVADVGYCQNYPSVPLTATTSGANYALIWYGLNKTNIPGDSSATYPAPPTAVVGTFTYWVSQYDSTFNCQSDTVDFDVIIHPTPLQPNAADPVYCLNAPASPFDSGILVAPSNYLTWYWLTDSLARPAVPPTPSTAVAGATWGYVTQTTMYLSPQNDTLRCESPREPFLVTVNPLPVATLIPVSALCVGTLTQNNGMLILNRFRDNDIAAWNMGSTFNTTASTGPADLLGHRVINPIPGDGILVSTLSNPTGPSQDYTVRVTNEFGCIIDVTEPLIAKDCTCPGGYCEPAIVTKTK
jgi:hypothetical protein